MYSLCFKMAGGGGTKAHVWKIWKRKNKIEIHLQGSGSFMFCVFSPFIMTSSCRQQMHCSDSTVSRVQKTGVGKESFSLTQQVGLRVAKNSQ